MHGPPKVHVYMENQQTFKIIKLLKINYISHILFTANHIWIIILNGYIIIIVIFFALFSLQKNF